MQHKFREMPFILKQNKWKWTKPTGWVCIYDQLVFVSAIFTFIL